MYRIYRKNNEILITKQDFKIYNLSPGVLLSRIVDTVTEDTIGTLGPMVKRRGMPAEKEAVEVSKIWVDKDVDGKLPAFDGIPVEQVQLPHPYWNS